MADSQARSARRGSRSRHGWRDLPRLCRLSACGTRRVSGKPAFLVANRQGTGDRGRSLIVEATRAGLPVLDGLECFLRGVTAPARSPGFRRALARVPPRHSRDGTRADPCAARGPPPVRRERRAARCSGTRGYPPTPAASSRARPPRSRPLARFGYPVGAEDRDARRRPQERPAGNSSFARGRVGGHGGVSRPCEPNRPARACRADDHLARRRDAARNGARRPVRPGRLLGAGGVHVEALADAVYAVPPFDSAEAARLVQRLRVAPLLSSRRHRRSPAIDEFCRVAERFSALAAEIGDEISEIDLNPVIVHADGCAIVDALVVPRPRSAT